jgi:hypothetical protein
MSLEREYKIYIVYIIFNGYHHTLEFDPTATTNRRRPRKRKVMYFNPLYSLNVKTNNEEKFLRLLDQHFPPGSPLHPLINRKKVKLSYRLCCLPNLKTEISRHNSTGQRVTSCLGAIARIPVSAHYLVSAQLKTLSSGQLWPASEPWRNMWGSQLTLSSKGMEAISRILGAQRAEQKPH